MTSVEHLVSLRYFRLAVGCGDHTVRVWNLGADTAYSTVSIWQGIRAKVLTVSAVMVISIISA